MDDEDDPRDQVLYAVAYGSPTHILFFWAEDIEHVKEQVRNAEGEDVEIKCVRSVPYTIEARFDG